MNIDSNKISKISFLSILIVTFSFLAPDTSHAELVYSHEFENEVVYSAGTPQYDDWVSFRALLPSSNVTSITLSGSRNTVGRTCSNPVATQEIANALRNAGAGTNPTETIFADVNCDGFLWRVVACDNVPNNVVISVLGEGDDLIPCSCDIQYSLGPAITDGDWGGIDGDVCGAETQTITLSVTAPRPVPTLSEWELIASALLLGITGLVVYSRRRAAV